MLKLEQIQKNAAISGIEPGQEGFRFAQHGARASEIRRQVESAQFHRTADTDA